MDIIYVVIYGDEYEDKIIFLDLEKAKDRLLKQYDRKNENMFTPFIETYSLSIDKGIFEKMDYEFFVNDEKRVMKREYYGKII